MCFPKATFVLPNGLLLSFFSTESFPRSSFSKPNRAIACHTYDMIHYLLFQHFRQAQTQLIVPEHNIHTSFPTPATSTKIQCLLMQGKVVNAGYDHSNTQDIIFRGSERFMHNINIVLRTSKIANGYYVTY